MRRYFFVIFAAALLGLIGPIMKIIGSSIPPMTVSFFRMFFATLFLLAIMPRMDKTFLHVKRKDLKDYAIIGLLMAFNFTVFVTAFTFAPVSNVVLLVMTFPFWLAVFSVIFLKEKITKFMLLCIGIAFIGIVIINPLSSIGNLGNILALIDGVTYAIIYAYMRFVDKKHTIGVVFWFVLFGTIFLSPMPVIFGLGTVSWNYLWIVFLGVACTGIAYLFLTIGLEKLQAEIVSIIVMTTEPIVSIMLAVVILAEVVSFNLVIGGIIIVAAGILIEKKYGLTRR